MIEIELPDGSIAEFPDGTDDDVIQKALRQQFPEKVGEGEDIARSFATGMARSIPKTLDFVSGLSGEGINQLYSLVGLPRAPLGEILDNTNYFNRGADYVFGEEYKPQTFAGNVSELGGGFVSPAAGAKLLKNGVGFVRGVAREAAPYVTDSKALLGKFNDWRKQIEATPITGSQIAKDIAEPFNKATKYTQPYADAASLTKVDQLNDLSKAAKTDLGYVYGLRKTLGNVDNSIAQPMREAIDSGLMKYANKDGLDAYRRYRVADDVDNALRNYGNETIKATRTKLNNLDKTGMSKVEREALSSAGRGSIGENILRLGGRGANAVTSAMTGIATGNVPAGLGMYATGRGLEKVADTIASKRIEALRGTILNGREAPNMGERFGAFVRGKLK